MTHPGEVLIETDPFIQRYGVENLTRYDPQRPWQAEAIKRFIFYNAEPFALQMARAPLFWWQSNMVEELLAFAEINRGTARQLALDCPEHLTGFHLFMPTLVEWPFSDGKTHRAVGLLVAGTKAVGCFAAHEGCEYDGLLFSLGHATCGTLNQMAAFMVELMENECLDVTAGRALPRHVSRRLARGGAASEDVETLVSTVTLRRLPSEDCEPGDGKRKLGLDKHWIVRAHNAWRAYGKGRKLRKRVRIGSYLKGDATRPLHAPPRVHVVKR